MGVARSDDAWITVLALAAGAGDRTAVTTFIRATQREVYRFHAYLCAGGAAEDLTRETYLRALRSLPSFAGRSSARTWLLSLARQVATERIPPSSTCPPTDTAAGGDVDVATDHAHHRSGWDAGALGYLVAGLDADRRDAFVLTQVLGLDYAAAAEVCDCPVSTIRSQLARAREDLVCAMHSLGWSGRRTTGL